MRMNNWLTRASRDILTICFNDVNIFISERTGETCEASGPEGS